ncbi:hypothetical protein F443_04851 [Phytophthora nicotianae P1569]|uniref:DDE Tnp4 domain-containing protein n=1 Tax=Phytophthora nicotianae P1569 TaxID=1317065 RepID=V9FKC4_PHYNI|nr:hypothetical protein F443_04851 [Phytophthora nicotianae P1569]
MLAFTIYWHVFEDFYYQYSPYSVNGSNVKLKPTTTRSGRPRSMTAEQCLAFELAWGRSAGPTSFLSLVFGVTASVMTLFPCFDRCLLVLVLKGDTKDQVNLPTSSEISRLQDAIGANYPLLSSVYAIMDGLKLRLQASDHSEIQNMFYNGWTHDHYVSNVFAFSPERLIIACALNAPGCMHDSQIAEWENVYAKLERFHQYTGGQVVVDSTFSKGTNDFLLKSGEDVALPTAIRREVTALRQSAEWGMRALQAAFPRLEDRLKYGERGERKCILLSIVLLFHLRTHLVGLNQILPAFYSSTIGRTANELFCN